MKLIDSNQLLVLSTDEVCVLSEDKVTNPEQFASFAAGIRIDPERLFSDEWQNANIGSDYKSLFDFIIKEMLPAFYDYDHLLKLGEFGISVMGIANYTIAPINGRVVGMDGAPVDSDTEREVIHFAINPDIFLAYCRGLTLAASESFLNDDDDEWEDREISTTELELYGMPAGAGGSIPSVCSSHGTGALVCPSHVIACGNNAIGNLNCAANTGACASNAGALGSCGSNVAACAANAGAGVGCAANVTACTVKATGGAICGAQTGVCGTAINIGSACGAKAGACGVDLAAGGCAANVGACGVNVPGDIVSACLINVIPLLPSC